MKDHKVLRILIVNLVIFAAIILPLAPAMAAEMVSGTVYQDDNGNQLRDEGEAGVADVLVSNGREITRTDAQGRYRIPLLRDDDAMIFVLKPRDYALPQTSQHIPRFWYQHDPDGSPARRYAGTPPTGMLPQSVDFALIAQAEPEHFSVAMIADPQVRNREQIDYYRRDIVVSMQRHPDIQLGFTLGDIVHDDLNLYPQLNEATAQLERPWFNVLGNHDMNLDAVDDLGSDDTYQLHYGPTTYALQYGPVHFIYFDNVIHWQDATGTARYHGGLREDQFRFIRNYLAAIPNTEQLVLLMHIPLVDRQGSNALRSADMQRLNRLLSAHPKVLSISGHAHLQRHFYLGAADGWQRDELHYHYNLGAACGSWWSGDLDAAGIPDATMQDGTPNGYSIIEFNSEGYVIDYHAARTPLDERMRVIGPGTIVRSAFAGGDVYVNVFNAEPDDAVEFRVDDEPWQVLRRLESKDPYVVMQNHRHLLRETIPDNGRLSMARDSSHLWSAHIGSDYATGEHRLQVRARDRYGREFFAEKRFTVALPEAPH